MYLKRIWKKLSNTTIKEEELYGFTYPLSWWNRFEDEAEVKIFPWRSFYSHHQKMLIPNNKLGEKMFTLLYNLEEKFPNFFVKYFQYPMIVLKKNDG